jgi:hypothetical protein
MGLQACATIANFIYLGETWIWTQSFVSAKQALYNLSHTSGYFGDGGILNYLLMLALNCSPPDLSILSSEDYKCEPLAPGLFFYFLQYCWLNQGFKDARQALYHLSHAPAILF